MKEIHKKEGTDSSKGEMSYFFVFLLLCFCFRPSSLLLNFFSSFLSASKPFSFLPPCFETFFVSFLPSSILLSFLSSFFNTNFPSFLPSSIFFFLSFFLSFFLQSLSIFFTFYLTFSILLFVFLKSRQMRVQSGLSMSSRPFIGGHNIHCYCIILVTISRNKLYEHYRDTPFVFRKCNGVTMVYW